MTAKVRDVAGGVTLAVKVVPGASTSRIVGPMGDAWKVQVTAPPEDGKANAALCEVLAAALGVANRSVQVVRGHGHARKVVTVLGISVALAGERLAAAAAKPRR